MIQFAETFATPGWEEIPPPVRTAPGNFGGACLSFAPAAGAHFAGVWSHWVEQVYGAHLLDAMLGVMSATRLDHTREPLALDAQVAARFPPAPVLRLPGARARHAPADRRHARVALGPAPAPSFGTGRERGLFPIVFALQSTIYNVPARRPWAKPDSNGVPRATPKVGPWDEPGEIANAQIFAQS